ncbi:MAG: arginine repressor [Actinomycetota bacterium]
MGADELLAVMKAERRRDLMKILHENSASTQQDIVAALQALGHDVTQATVSRDLQEMGAVKVRLDGRVVYALPDDVPRGGDLVARDLLRNLREFALDIRAAASLVVVQTAPGHASAVARAIDLAGLAEVVGTVAGDDTIFVATPSGETAQELVSRWRSAAQTSEVA